MTSTVYIQIHCDILFNLISTQLLIKRPIFSLHVKQCQQPALLIKIIFNYFNY